MNSHKEKHSTASRTETMCNTCDSYLTYVRLGAVVLALVIIGGTPSLPSTIELAPRHAPAADIPPDTSRLGAIPATPCTIYDWFVESTENEKAKMQAFSPRYIGSLHEISCQRTVMTQGLSVSFDSTHLPRYYVEVMSDTLRLEEDAFAYAVQLRPTPTERQRMKKTMYLVANMSDSLYYRRLRSKHVTAERQQQFSIRGLRALNIPGAKRTYIWLELESLSQSRQLVPHPTTPTDSVPATAFREWQGYVFNYDATQGLQYLLDGVVPIRGEKVRAGKTVAFEQWDVSFPEPGIMTVSVRARQGEVLKDSPYFASPDWLGPHVIDREAVSDSSRYRYLLEEPEIWKR
jgi:hypothetical protein